MFFSIEMYLKILYICIYNLYKKVRKLKIRNIIAKLLKVIRTGKYEMSEMILYENLPVVVGG